MKEEEKGAEGTSHLLLPLLLLCYRCCQSTQQSGPTPVCGSTLTTHHLQGVSVNIPSVGYQKNKVGGSKCLDPGHSGPLLLHPAVPIPHAWFNTQAVTKYGTAGGC